MKLGRKIVVAMSGGVDSSVAAYILKKEGFDVIGVSMQMYDSRKNTDCGSRAMCPSPADFKDARLVAGQLDIPYYVLDFENIFEKEVIAPFVEQYQIGLTPNPCVDCNHRVKFRALRDRATSLGCAGVATGHYARIVKDNAGFHLARARFREKDQSYFLYNLLEEDLHQTFFPIGELTKKEVRNIASKIGLSTADKPESQDVCFIHGSVKDFIVGRGVEKALKGSIVFSDGRVLGFHNGIHEFTVGQRKGLKIGGLEQALYVVEIRAQDNTIIVGSRHELERSAFQVCSVHLLDATVKHSSAFDAHVQVRSRHAGSPVRVFLHDNGTAVVNFLNNPVPVAPGQAAVFYDMSNQRVLGGGRIAPHKNG